MKEKVKTASKFIGKGLLKILAFCADYFMFFGIFYLLYRENLGGAFLVCFMVIGLEVKEINVQLKKSNADKIKEEASKIIKKISMEMYVKMHSKGEDNENGK